MKDKSNKTSRKGGRKFCPTQAPVYRQTEMLLAWAVPVVDSLPKSLAAQTMGRKIIEDIMESLDAISLALIAEKGEARLELINVAAQILLEGVHREWRFPCSEDKKEI